MADKDYRFEKWQHKYLRGYLKFKETISGVHIVYAHQAGCFMIVVGNTTVFPFFENKEKERRIYYATSVAAIF